MPEPVYQPHEQRVFAERAELSTRIAALSKFIGSERFQSLSEQDASDLSEQLFVMHQLSRILGRRIARFVPVAAEMPAHPIDASQLLRSAGIGGEAMLPQPWTVINESSPSSFPARRGNYLVTVETEGDREVHVLEYVAGKWMHDGEYTFQHGYQFRPIAWAPRPPAFSGEIPE